MKPVCDMANNRIGYWVMTFNPRERLFENALSIGMASQC